MIPYSSLTKNIPNLTGLSLLMVTSDTTISSTSLIMTISGSVFSDANMITYSPDTLVRTRPLNVFDAIIPGLGYESLSKSTASLVLFVWETSLNVINCYNFTSYWTILAIVLIFWLTSFLSFDTFPFELLIEPSLLSSTFLSSDFYYDLTSFLICSTNLI